ncbi:hypothetical protein PUNSTDRAFT_137701 [Punctularia strigosozonata HHB-11173 SS5]|uniref:uncharacterized protein n=1 Tax=Punctularia strigosozonata (strain HHB-11173) TaxID=741275 RepID=UPI00044184B5|nr:uncharacterized protein PUNSTDRAFT_137701 [Punctularia strigosozonata HHB-11173 SS5]EIN05596.1 hypothetical protein PUNSTDRAFT_137701 [Punctularia strigosozonata HHB-11173 SS5]
MSQANEGNMGYAGRQLPSYGDDTSETTTGASGALQEAPIDVSSIGDKARNWSNEMRERAPEEGASFDPSSQANESRQGIGRDAHSQDQYPVSDTAKRATEAGISRTAALDDLKDEVGYVSGQVSTVGSQGRS